VSNNFTRIDDDTVEFENVYLNKLKEYDYVATNSIESSGKGSILCGREIFNGGNNSIIVGEALKDVPSSTGKFPNNI